MEVPKIESVWDYPRPPRVELSGRLVKVFLAQELIANSSRAFRVLETSHPPTWYIPPIDIRMDLLRATERTTFCEWKGHATYWTVQVGPNVAENAAWSYREPSKPFAAIQDCVAFYASVFECYVDDERVQPQPGGFYGGWVTRDVAGPFKGAPGSRGW